MVELIAMAIGNLGRHKLRASLAVLGIILGVASLIVLVSLMDGIRSDIEDAFSSAQGARVTPKKSSDPVLNFLDEEWGAKIGRVQGVKASIPIVIQAARTIDGKEQSPFDAPRVLGIDLGAQAKATGSGFNGELLEGRDFKPSDRGVALIGKKVKKDFSKFLGTKIKVNEKQFTVVGIYTTGSDLLDASILLPIQDARGATEFPENKISYVNVQFSNPSDDRKVVDRINLLYGDEIRAQSTNDFSAQFGMIFDNVTLLVAVIASIASIVAAVGIINTMLMSVLERFKEIGALKAVGWTNGNIMFMILLESFFVGVFGGILGVILGVASSLLIGTFGFTITFTPYLLAGSFLGAVFVGVLGGLYPAYIASRMDPVEALRAE